MTVVDNFYYLDFVIGAVIEVQLRALSDKRVAPALSVWQIVAVDHTNSVEHSDGNPAGMEIILPLFMSLHSVISEKGAVIHDPWLVKTAIFLSQM